MTWFCDNQDYIKCYYLFGTFMIQKKPLILNFLLLFPCSLQASFIESSMGTAVVNDATATYHNPAALMLVKKSQIVGLGSKATYQSQFVGQSFETIGGFFQSGTAKEHTNYNLPSAYMAFPIQEKIRLGLALLWDRFSSDIDEPSILKYDQSSNQIKNIDYVLGGAFQVNDYLSIGAGATYSSASFTSQRITGFPRLDVPDSQSNNRTKGDSQGWNLGFLIKPLQSTLIGFNYRSAVSYQFKGRSEFEGPPLIVSDGFSFNFWTPARSVITVSHFITPTWGFIGTAQRIQWSVFRNVTMRELATQLGRNSLIIPSATIPYHFRDTWLFTVGGIKKVTDKWVVRVAGTYNQAPGNGAYRITSGDGYVLGASTGYQLSKNLIIDASYAHVFIKNQPIDIVTPRKQIVGTNKGYRDSISLKLTLTV